MIDASHKGQLTSPESALMNFSADLTAALDKPSLHGDDYQMIIMIISKYEKSRPRPNQKVIRARE
jgi:hypothetical protein